jgi:partitioning defective protein 6
LDSREQANSGWGNGMRGDVSGFSL